MKPLSRSAFIKFVLIGCSSFAVVFLRRRPARNLQEDHGESETAKTLPGQSLSSGKKFKLHDNVPGKYYVDDQCIDCDLCRETAPRSFARNAAEGHAYVSHQPVDSTEESLCKEAMAGCPVEAIKSDGDIP